jgi:hypothetical protein
MAARPGLSSATARASAQPPASAEPPRVSAQPPRAPAQSPRASAQPPRAEPPLVKLAPELISGLLGRWQPKHPDSQAFVLARIMPRTRFYLIGLTALIGFIGLAYACQGLTSPAGTPTAIGLIVSPVGHPVKVSLPLLQDPVGLIAVVMTLLTPILFAEQVRAIGVFNETNERNIAYRAASLDFEAINREVGIANSRFRFIGRGDISLVVLLLSAAASFGILALIHKWGLFPNWNYTHLSDSQWKDLVYAGWWANPGAHHAILAIALFLVGCYFFYFVIKQVYMGAVFVIYMQKIARRRFGVSPNMTANTDGFWGLSPLRGFMLATYSSSLGHTIMIVGILIVWLPFSLFTLLMLALVTIITTAEVIYPTRVGYQGAYREKTYFVSYVLVGTQRPSAAKMAQVEAIWARPLLPFRVMSTLTTVTISLLFPLLLAVVSRLLGH